MTNAHKCELMKTALKRVGCDVLYLQHSNLAHIDYILAIRPQNDVQNANDIGPRSRLFIEEHNGNLNAITLHSLGMTIDCFSFLTWDTGIVYFSDYWKVFDALVALKRNVCTGSREIVLSKNTNNIYKLEVECDLCDA